MIYVLTCNHLGETEDDWRGARGEGGDEGDDRSGFPGRDGGRDRRPAGRARAPGGDGARGSQPGQRAPGGDRRNDAGGLGGGGAGRRLPLGRASGRGAGCRPPHGPADRGERPQARLRRHERGCAGHGSQRRRNRRGGRRPLRRCRHRRYPADTGRLVAAIYASGPAAAEFGALRGRGLDIRVMDAPSARPRQSRSASRG